MKLGEERFYVDPVTQRPLQLRAERVEGGSVLHGELVSPEGVSYPIRDGIPDFTWPKELAQVDEEFRRTYERLAHDYDKYASIPFQTYRVREADVRERMVDQLEIRPGMRVLEIGSGDGRGAEHIARRMAGEGKLYLQELSPAFLNKAVERLEPFGLDVEYSVANASYLSFPDDVFDAAHHFGGINTFSEVERCLKELVRVVKPGGKVVVGDEGLGPWLRESQFGKIMSNSNPLLRYEIPFHHIPVEARDVRVEWIMMGAFFVLEFRVGEGEPFPDYHVPIPSERGGTHWSRYHGNLEGVSEEAKRMAALAREKSGKSMHQWLDDVVRQAATSELQA